MFVGYFFARKVLKLDILNTLGSICGGMTSTPALGSLIRVAGTDDVASAYAATYPFALVCVVLACQFIGMI
jgi:putative transport protein